MLKRFKKCEECKKHLENYKNAERDYLNWLSNQIGAQEQITGADTWKTTQKAMAKVLGLTSKEIAFITKEIKKEHYSKS